VTDRDSVVDQLDIRPDDRVLRDREKPAFCGLFVVSTSEGAGTRVGIQDAIGVGSTRVAG
jgi:hypothetical protein